MIEFAKENPLVALLMTYAVCKTVRGVSYYYIAHKYPLPEQTLVVTPEPLSSGESTLESV